MKIKRYFSHDMRTAIRMVRDELGSDAVILSNNRVNGGVEVVAAVDYDESLLDADTRISSTINSNKNAPRLVDHEHDSQTAAKRVYDISGQQSARQKSNKSSRLTDIGTPSNKKLLYKKPGKNLPGAITTSDGVNDIPSFYSDDVANSRGADESGFDESLDYQHDQDSFDFFSIEGLDSEHQCVNDTLLDTTQGDVLIQTKSKSSPDISSNITNVWSQEPTLVSMRNEITTLRNLVEKQLTGLAWGEVARKNPLRAKLLRQLLELDFSPQLTAKIADAASTQEDYTKAWQVALTTVSNKLPVIKEDLIETGGIVALLGATGVGKTTTIAKLAARFAMRSGRNNVALVTTDSYRIGAHEQLRTYGRILGIPVRMAKNKTELVEILKVLSDKDFVLVDTAGMSQRDQRLLQQFTLIRDCAPALTTLLVLSATTHRAGLEEAAKIFSNVSIDGCILTKLDETTNLGGALSVLIECNIPLAFVCDGQKVPEDIHMARAHAIINRCVLIARQSHQSMADESIELAYSKMRTHAHV